MSSTSATTSGTKIAQVFSDSRGVPTERAPLGTRLKYALVIRRIEFLPIHMVIGLVPTVLGARAWGELASVNAVVAFLFCVTHMQMADMLNALADRELDATYKSRQPKAVYGLGVRKVVAHFAVTSALYLGASVFLAVRTGHWDLVPIALAGWLMGVAYSLPPLHLKSAGLWQLPTLQFGCVFIPGMFALRAYEHPLEWASVLVVVGLSLTLTGTFVTNHAEDYLEDQQFGIRTYVIALGIRRAMQVQSAMLALGALMVLGAVLLGFGFTWGLALYAVVWLVSQRYIWMVTSGTRDSFDTALATVRKHALSLPYHGVALGFTNVALALFVLGGR
ncbi:UbiA family prenyltransferase [Streptomyces sp. MUM 178J]|uniref:UbiA family prenyltransferase n=1 Tax=Streptomyces sp. MUM 178J TaxID=2791991 RepID=UPI001F0359AB|nr:UbiA family prenyltransferase [Streptomyces sp. MUM 178J]WRQ83083.1 UbiA family prenyltransferase [Streptomyces sp. MUM 178J]